MAQYLKSPLREGLLVRVPKGLALPDEGMKGEICHIIGDQQSDGCLITLKFDRDIGPVYRQYTRRELGI